MFPIRLSKMMICVLSVFCCSVAASCSDSVNPPVRTDPSTSYQTSRTGQSGATRPPSGEGGTTTPKESLQKVTLSFVGDCLIATADGTTHRPGSLNWTADRQPPSYFFEKVAGIFANDDFTIANCENVFTDSDLPPVKKKQQPAFWFKSATKNAAILKSGNVDIVSLANNHTDDYGAQGFDDTENAVKSTGILTGYGGKPVVVEKNGIRIGIVCCGFWDYNQHRGIVNEMKRIEEDTDIQIIFFHGGTEKIHQPEEWKVSGARELVDAGADLVVGGHPHVLQPMEIYKGVPIVYSLGNFVYGGNTMPENRTIIFQAFFEKIDGEIKLSTDIIPCYVYGGKTNNWQPYPIENKTHKSRVLDFMKGKRELPY